MTSGGTVSNRMFGILVDGYISAVDGYRKKSDDRGKQGDVSLAYFSTLTLIIITFLKLSLSSSLAHLPSKTPVRSTLPHNTLFSLLFFVGYQEVVY
jgi:hypothetical protein